MPSVMILGSNSDIARGLEAQFAADGWEVQKWYRTRAWPAQYAKPWDLCVCAIGTLSPIGKFFDTEEHAWRNNFESNALLPLTLIRNIWALRNPGASVCFFSGAGVSRGAQTYSAYAASKIMLYKMTELLDDEYEDTKFFILGPGMVKTKIQDQTLAVGKRAANYERVYQFINGSDPMHGTGTPMDKIYRMLMWARAQPKEVVGGRNLYVPTDVPGEELALKLWQDKNRYKLRRSGDA